MATDTARLRALLAAATPGPWRGDRHDGTIKYKVVGGKNGEYLVFDFNVQSLDAEECGLKVFVALGDEDETLMLEAVNALPGLLDDNERLRAVMEIMCITGLVERENIDQAERIYRSTKEAINAKG